MDQPSAAGCTFSRIVALGALIRLGYVCIGVRSAELSGDALYYSATGQLLAAGKGFARPFVDSTIPAADHPPLATIVMAIGPLFVDDSATWFGLPAYVFLQRLTLVVVGTVTVALIGLVGTRVGGRTVGLVAAGIAAVHPSLWINDGILMAESVTAATLALLMLATLAAVDNPTMRAWSVVGLCVGAAALARAESLLLLPIMVIPMILASRRAPGDDGVRHPLPRRAAGSCAALCAAVCATWLVPNAVRFEEPVGFTTSDGLLLIGANCPQTYGGDHLGTWSLGCLRFFDSDGNDRDDFRDRMAAATSTSASGDDGSRQNIEYRRAAIEFAFDNPNRWPAVISTRVLRTWGLWDPAGMVEFNEGEGRPSALSWLAWAIHLLLVPIAIWGAVLLRREGRPWWVFASQAVSVTLVSALVYGLARFRLSWDLAACVLAAVAINWLYQRRQAALA